MRWEKKGLVFCPKGENLWDNNSFMTPTPILLDNETIRIYGGMRDIKGVSRIGFVDLEVENPSIIKKVSKVPILDIGKEGMFDDNGVILGDVVSIGEKFFMYYVGFQIVQKVKFLAFTGLAISEDNGETFNRYSQVPIMDRADNALFIRAIHSVLIEDNKIKIWYSVGNGWEFINDIPYPQYDIRYTESNDGINFCDNVGQHCIGVEGNEYRIGRPRVRKVRDKYEMRYTYDTKNKEYRTGYAESISGLKWTRKDHLSGLNISQEGWDSEMVCYPAIIETLNNTYMFYSGNGMGRTGFGYAELAED